MGNASSKTHASRSVGKKRGMRSFLRKKPRIVCAAMPQMRIRQRLNRLATTNESRDSNEGTSGRDDGNALNRSARGQLLKNPFIVSSR